MAFKIINTWGWIKSDLSDTNALIHLCFPLFPRVEGKKWEMIEVLKMCTGLWHGVSTLARQITANRKQTCRCSQVF